MSAPGRLRVGILVADQIGRHDLARLAVELDREITGTKVRDDGAVTIEHRRFDDDHVDAGAEARRRLGEHRDT